MGGPYFPGIGMLEYIPPLGCSPVGLTAVLCSFAARFTSVSLGTALSPPQPWVSLTLSCGPVLPQGLDLLPSNYTSLHHHPPVLRPCLSWVFVSILTGGTLLWGRASGSHCVARDGLNLT